MVYFDWNKIYYVDEMIFLFYLFIKDLLINIFGVGWVFDLNLGDFFYIIWLCVGRSFIFFLVLLMVDGLEIFYFEFVGIFVFIVEFIELVKDVV